MELGGHKVPFHQRASLEYRRTRPPCGHCWYYSTDKARELSVAKIKSSNMGIHHRPSMWFYSTPGVAVPLWMLCILSIIGTGSRRFYGFIISNSPSWICGGALVGNSQSLAFCDYIKTFASSSAQLQKLNDRMQRECILMVYWNYFMGCTS